jgi:hypothetical protein
MCTRRENPTATARAGCFVPRHAKEPRLVPGDFRLMEDHSAAQSNQWPKRYFECVATYLVRRSACCLEPNLPLDCGPAFVLSCGKWHA